MEKNKGPQGEQRRDSLPHTPLAKLAAEVAQRNAALGKAVEPDPDGAAAKLFALYQRDPTKAADDLFELFQESYAVTIRPHLEDFAKAARLQNADPDFGDLVLKAIGGCLLQHGVIGSKRPAHIRKEILQASKVAEALCKDFRKMRSVLGELSPESKRVIGKQGNQIFNLEMIHLQAGKYDLLSAYLQRSADLIKPLDKGGRPEMAAFQTLVRGLARAFQQSSGRAAKVTWSEHRQVYGGPFLSLVEAVLPPLQPLAENYGRPLVYPDTADARGAYIYNLTRAGKNKATRG